MDRAKFTFRLSADEYREASSEDRISSFKYAVRLLLGVDVFSVSFVLFGYRPVVL
jgi:hypothetical protein